MPPQIDKSEESYPLHGCRAELAAHHLLEHLSELSPLRHEDAPLFTPVGVQRQEEHLLPSQYVASSRARARIYADDRILLGTISQMIRYTFATMRNKSSNRVAQSCGGRCEVQQEQVIW